MIETKSYEKLLGKTLLDKYSYMETGDALKVVEAICPDEYRDLLRFLDEFSFTSSMLMTPGGNQSVIARSIDESFAKMGWKKARLDVARQYYLFENPKPEVTAEHDPAKFKSNLIYTSYQVGYIVDNYKGRVVIDGEWTPKDGNLDRDFSAYRSWFDDGAIAAAVLVTRMQRDTKTLSAEIWEDFVGRNPMYRDYEQTVSFSTSTTSNFEKAAQRILRGDLGSCPILMIGIGRACWMGDKWSGEGARWDKSAGAIVPKEIDFKPKKK